MMVGLRRGAALSLLSLVLAGGVAAFLYMERTSDAFPPLVGRYEFAGQVYPASRVDELLDSEAYRRHFDEVYARTRIVADAPSLSRCDEKGLWRYRTRDALRPFRTDMDWTAPPAGDDNWSWHHHSLAILDCPLGRFMHDPGDKAAVRDIRALIADWMRDNNTASPANPQFSWGDHTTARRLRKVIYLFAMLEQRKALEPAFQRELVSFVRLHTDRLLRDTRVIRQRHNHALDQVQALALSEAYFPFLRYDGFDLRQEVRARFAMERIHLIAADGVQTENSPAYHMWVTVRVATMERMFNLGNDQAGLEGPLARNNRSLAFATWIQKPNGELPQIGDTAPGKGARIRLPMQSALPGYPNYAYAQTQGARGKPPKGNFRLFRDSGYLIYRDDWLPPLSDDTHLVMKCGFKAEGHRHSDDGTISLAARGEDWFVDTGMYGYQAGPHRAHALSPAAHNLSYVPGATIRKVGSARYREHAGEWGMSPLRSIAQGHAQATCTSFMYPGARYARTLTIDNGAIELADTFTFDSIASSTPVTRFNIPYDKRISVGPDGQALVCSAKDCIRIAFDPARFARWSIIDGAKVKADAFRTTGYLKAAPIRVLELAWKDGVRSVSFQIHPGPVHADVAKAGTRSHVPASP